MRIVFVDVLYDVCSIMCFFCFKQKTAYEMRISDWSSDVCSSDLLKSRRSGRGVAQPGSASHWGCGGRRFESSRPDQKNGIAASLYNGCDENPATAGQEGPRPIEDMVESSRAFQHPS